MDLRFLDKIKNLVHKYIRLLDEEHAVICELIGYMYQFQSVEMMRKKYVAKLEEIGRLQQENYQFLKMLEDIASVYSCTSSGIDSDIRIDIVENAEQRLKEKENFMSAIDSLEIIDDDDIQTIMDAEAEAKDIATSISEVSIDTPVTEKEKSTLRRKQLADALRKGETVTIFPDGEISDLSTEDAIADLDAQLTDSGDDSERYGIQVPNGKMAGGHGMCRICGTVFYQVTNYCPECGTKTVIEKPAVDLNKVQFSAVVPKTFMKGDYSIIEIIMYEEAFRNVVEEAIANADEPMKETRSGILTAEKNAKITIFLTSPDIDIEDNNEIQTWQGDYLSFSFAVEIPEQYKKKQILFVASVYINDIIATRLKFVVQCKSLIEQKIEVTRDDVLSAFVSYASQDRNRVAMIIQGMKKARPDMDIFFDVESLRSGDDWENALWREIDKRDVLFLCWSRYARDSKWVDAEWRYALKQKGVDSIEPVPIDPPGRCPPPDELSRKHFNDKLLYIINSDATSIATGGETLHISESDATGSPEF